MTAVLQLVGDGFVGVASDVPEFRPKGLTLPELRRWFLTQYASPLAKATRTNYERTLTLAVEGTPGHGKFGAVRPLPDFPSPRDVARWLGEMATGGYASTTVHLRRTDLVHVYEAGSQCAQTWGNPAIHVPWRADVPKRAPLADVRGTWAFLAEALPLRERAFVAVLRFLGCRKGEALGLEARHIDWKRGLVHIDQQRTKANSRATTRKLKSEASRRWVPMRAELRDVLRELIDEEGTEHEVKSGKGGGKRTKTKLLFPFGEYQLKKILDVLRGVDPEGFPPADAFHVFRHTVAVELWRAGKSEAFIQEWLGHASLEKTATYLRSLDGRRISALEVAALDPDYRPKKPKKKSAKKTKAPELGLAVPTPSSVTEVGASAVVAVPPAEPAKAKKMKTTTAVEATPTATTTTPAVAELPAVTFAEVRKLGN